MTDAIGIVLFAALGFMLGIVCAVDMERDNAIEAGVAHYVCDDRGDCEFEYKGGTK